MSSPLQVDDVDALHALSSRLGEVAARIENPRLAAPPQLGELATGRAVADATRVVQGACGRLGANVRQMSDLASSSATSYAEMEQRFGEQLRRYAIGE
ncbi:hypothetical protein GS966_05710 [Rhodococcus hoagii]|nr:hypothetical protein [Prescottella equi]NKZ89427.1 hypothetical protein [Prescottella equi]